MRSRLCLGELFTVRGNNGSCFALSGLFVSAFFLFVCLFATNLYKNMISHTPAYKGFCAVLAVIGGATCQLSEILQAIFPYASCLNNRVNREREKNGAVEKKVFRWTVTWHLKKQSQLTCETAKIAKISILKFHTFISPTSFRKCFQPLSAFHDSSVSFVVVTKAGSPGWRGRRNKGSNFAAARLAQMLQE